MGGAQSRPDDMVEMEGLPRAGDVIAGKYQVESMLGAGGMGVVVFARHLLLNQPVAMKFLHPNAAVRSDPLQRFLREARAAAALRSEHVARVLDVGTLPSGDPFMVMEYLEGAPLSRVIRTRAPLPIDEAVDFMLQACDAIGEAHSLGIIHRDLKPGNMHIVKRPNGTPLLKVLDFGISKIVDGEAAEFEQTLTATNMIMGSPQYASPEQLRSSKNVDRRTDIWSLGVILYYMLTGRRPFEGDTMSSLCLAIAVERPPPIRSIRPEVPDALADVVMRCLEKDREQRMPDISTLAAALRPFAPASAQRFGLSSPSPIAAGLITSSPPQLGTGDVINSSSQPSTLLSHATTEPRAASLMTRSAWVAPEPQRRSQVLMLQLAGAAVVLGLATWVFIQIRRSGSSRSDSSVVEAVGPVQPAATPAPNAAPPTSAAGPSEGIIDENFRPPPPPPTLAAPPPATAMVKEPTPPAGAASTPIIREGWGVTKTSVNLKDREGLNVGTVPKGGLVRVMQEERGWSLVMHASKGGMLMGWAPATAIVPPPPSPGDRSPGDR